MYLYTTHDEDEIVGNFYTMMNWRCYSSTDMVNWTDNGEMMSEKTFSWAEDRCWAGQCVERNGKFYFYVPIHKKNGGVVIGVGVADSPTGPFKAAIETPLIEEGDWNDIDPTVYVDDDNQAYLYFGNPELRYVKLNEDMISYDKTVGIVKIPMTKESFGESTSEKDCSYAEGPWFYKRNGLYYMVYPAFGPDGGSEHIAYSTSEGPTGPWVYGGILMPAQGGSYTNHPGVIDYKGKSFLFYHNQALPGGSSYHRSVCTDEFSYNSDNTINTITDMTKEGPDSVDTLNPYKRTEAETICWEDGIETEACSNGTQDVYAISNGDSIKLRDVNFGENGVKTFSACTSSDAAKGTTAGTIEVCIDSKDSKPQFTYEVKGTGSVDDWANTAMDLTCNITGEHDVYLVFKGEESDNLFKFDYWQFGEKAPIPTATPVATQVPATKVPTTPVVTTPTVNAVTATPSAIPVAAAPTIGKTQIKSLKNTTVKSVKLVIKKTSAADGYQIVYASNKKFTKNKKIIKAKKTEIKIKKLKKGKTYYFKVRSFKSVNDKTYYGKFGSVKRVKINK